MGTKTTLPSTLPIPSPPGMIFSIVTVIFLFYPPPRAVNKGFTKKTEFPLCPASAQKSPIFFVTKRPFRVILVIMTREKFYNEYLKNQEDCILADRHWAELEAILDDYKRIKPSLEIHGADHS